MSETRPRQDSSRELLEELEDGWAATPAAGATSKVPIEPDSIPDVNDLDEGWLDNLFPEEDEEEEEEELPELPDERLDPEAFAAAKKLRDEKIAARKEKKKQKLEAKRARQRAKAAAMRQKQKGKSKKSRAPAPPPSSKKAAKAEKKAKSRAPKPPVSEKETEEESLEAEEDLASAPAPMREQESAPAIRPNTMQSIRLLAIVLAVLIALGLAVAVIAK
jgi:hypothetical protein